MSDSEESCCPDFPGASYSRGPTDKNPAMFTFERKMADAIASRCGATSDPASGVGDSKTGKGISCPGQD